MSRIRTKRVQKTHIDFMEAAIQWPKLYQETLLQYGFSYGVHHGLCAAEKEKCAQLLSGFQYYNQRLRYLGRNGVHALRQDIEALVALETAKSLVEDAGFFRKTGHLLTRELPTAVSTVLLQLAAETGESNHLGEEAWQSLRETSVPCILSLARDAGGNNACTAVIEHDARLRGAKILAAGYILSWTQDGMLFLADQRGRNLASVQAHQDVTGLAVLDQSIYTWDVADDVIRVWTVHDLSLVHELHGHKAGIVSVEMQSDTIISTSLDGEVRCWKPAAEQAYVAVQAARPNISEVFPLQDGALLIPEKGEPKRISFSQGSVTSVHLQNSQDRRTKVDFMRAIPDGRLLLWSKRGVFFVLDKTLSKPSVEGSLTEGAGSGMFGGIPTQQMSVLNSELVASWGESSMFSKAPCEVRIWSLQTAEQVATLATTAAPSKAIQCGDNILVSESDASITLFQLDGTKKWQTKLESSALSGFGKSGIDGLLPCGDTLLCWQRGSSKSSFFANTKVQRLSLVDGQPQAEWTKHDASIKQVRAGGNMVASMDANGIIHLGTILEGGKEIALRGTCIEVAPDGSVYVGQQDGSLWKVDGYEPEKVAQHTAPVQGILHSPTGVFSWCRDGYLIDITSQKKVALTFENSSTSLFLKATLRGNRLYTFHSGDALRIWDTENAYLLARQGLSSYSLQWLDEHTLITGKGLWRLDKQLLWVAKTTIGDGLTRAPADYLSYAQNLNPDSVLLEEEHWVSASREGLVRLHNKTAELLLNKEQYGACSLHGNQHGVASWSKKGTVAYVDKEYFWHQQIAEEEIVAARACMNQQLMVFLTDGRLLFLSENGKPQYFHGHAEELYGFESVGSFGLSWSADRSVRCWNLQAQLQDVPQKAYHRGGVNGVLRVPGQCVSWGEDGIIRVWDESTGQCIQSLEKHTNSVLGARRVGDEFLSWDKSGAIIIWRCSDWTCRAVLHEHKEKIVDTLVIDNQRLLSWSEDKNLLMWSLASAEVITTFTGHEKAVLAAEMRGDDILSWSRDGTVRLWSMAGEEIEKLQVEKSSTFFRTGVHSLKVIREKGWFIATTDKTLAFWRQEDWSKAQIVKKKKSQILKIGVLDFGSLVVVHSSMMSLMLGKKPAIDFWDLESGKQESIAEMISKATSQQEGLTQNDIMKQLQATMQSLAAASPQATKAEGWELEGKEQNLLLTKAGTSLYWLGESDLKAQYIDPSGLLCATSKGGEVHLLQLYKSGQPITLAGS